MNWLPPFLAIWAMAFCLVIGWAIQSIVDNRRHTTQQETLPPILPAWIFDNSELPDGVVWYCPDCWLDWIKQGEHMYFEPDGVRQFCAAHLTSTLAHALDAQSMEKHT